MTDSDALAQFAERKEITALRRRAEAAEARCAKMAAALKECEEYFDGKADAEYFPDRATPLPNAEMRLLGEVRAALSDSAPEYEAVIEAALDWHQYKGTLSGNDAYRKLLAACDALVEARRQK